VVSAVLSLSFSSATSQEGHNGGEDKQERGYEGQNEAVASGGDTTFGVGEDSDPPEPAQKNEDESEEVHASTQQAANQRRTATVGSLGGSTDNVGDNSPSQEELSDNQEDEGHDTSGVETTEHAVVVAPEEQVGLSLRSTTVVSADLEGIDFGSRASVK